MASPRKKSDSGPLVTVYIANHNYGHYLKQSVESVLAQTMQDFELIIIDDGSTDNSREIIEAYAADPRISVIYQNNQGLNVTNNIALRSSVGTYIMRLDADDYLDKDALLVMTTRLENNPDLGLVFPDYFIVDGEGNIQEMERRHDFNGEVSLLDQPAHGACTMIRRFDLLEIGGYDEDYRCQDGYELWIKFIAKYKVANVNLPLFYYRRHSQNLTRNEDQILETRAAIKRIHAIRKGDPLRVIAIVPVRGKQVHHGSLAMEVLGDKPMVDWLVDASLSSHGISLTIVTSPDKDVEEHILSKYGDKKDTLFFSRPPFLARMNMGLADTIEAVLDHPDVAALDPEVIVNLSIEYPLVTGSIIDDAIHTCRIFECDSVISVRPELGKFYQHNGHGMRLHFPRESFTRLEREALFREAGGVRLTTVEQFRKTRRMTGDRMGHIVVDEKAAHPIRSAFELSVADHLASDT